MINIIVSVVFVAIIVIGTIAIIVGPINIHDD